MFKAFLVGLMLTMALVFVPASPAMASHVGPFVANSTNIAQWGLIRGHDGLRYWERLDPGEYSPRGANGFGVRTDSRLQYKSYTTGRYYWTPCGRDLPTWAGMPFQSIPSDRSVFITAEDYYPWGMAGSCGG